MEKEPTVETIVQPAVAEQTPDYKALLNKAEEERDNYKKGLLKAKGKIPDEPMSEEDKEDLASRVAAKLAPELKSSLVSTVAKETLDSKLDKLSSNSDERELIRYHFEFSTAGEDIDTRLANAKAIANKDLIDRKASEIQQIRPKVNNSTSMGSSSDSQVKSTDNYFTPDQIKDLEKRYAAAGLKLDLSKVKENIERVKRGEGMNLHDIK